MGYLTTNMPDADHLTKKARLKAAGQTCFACNAQVIGQHTCVGGVKRAAADPRTVECPTCPVRYAVARGHYCPVSKKTIRPVRTQGGKGR